MFVDQFQEFMGTYVSPNFRVSQPNTTTVQVVASSGNGQVSCAISGRWRYNTGTVSAAHPGGASGTYDLYVTGSDNSFTPGTPEVDNTVYAFGIQIKAAATTPSTAIFRKVGTVEWDGAAITRVVLDVPRQEVLDFVGGVAAGVAAQARVLGDSQPRIKIQSDGALLWGSGSTSPDVKAYRSAADALSVDDSVRLRSDVAGAARFLDVVSPDSLAFRGLVRAMAVSDTQPRVTVGLGTAGDGRIEAGPGGSTVPDTNLYRIGASQWGTDDGLAMRADVAGAARYLDLVSSSDVSISGAMRLFAAGEAQARLQVLIEAGTGSPALYFGPGGATAPDVALKRTGAQELTAGATLVPDAVRVANSNVAGQGADQPIYSPGLPGPPSPTVYDAFPFTATRTARFMVLATIHVAGSAQRFSFSLYDITAGGSLTAYGAGGASGGITSIPSSGDLAFTWGGMFSLTNGHQYALRIVKTTDGQSMTLIRNDSFLSAMPVAP